MKFAMKLAFAACLMLVMGLQAQAAQAKSFVLLPFEVHAPQNYSYLSKAVPSTLMGRLSATGATGSMGPRAAGSAAEARKFIGGADYALWGTVSVMGNDCTIVLNSVDKKGATWSQTAQGPMSGLNATVQRLAGAFSSEVLGVAGAAAAGRAGRSDIIRNETGQTESYLNPQFRYQGNSADGSRIRSQRLKDEMVDMAVADFNGDGRNEIAILHDHRLVIYKWGNDGRLGKLGEITISRSNLNFSMRAIDLNRDGAKDLVVATFEEESNRPYSYFYSFRGNKFTEVAKRCSYFVSVINLPPSYQPTLVGQGWDSIKLFAPGVYMMVKQNGTYVLGQRINLPSGANVFNVAWIPGKNGDQLVMLTDDERLKIFQGANQTLIHTTMERFSGCNLKCSFCDTQHGTLLRFRHRHGALQGHAGPGRGPQLPDAQQVLCPHASHRGRHRPYGRIYPAGQQAHLHGGPDFRPLPLLPPGRDPCPILGRRGPGPEVEDPPHPRLRGGRGSGRLQQRRHPGPGGGPEHLARPGCGQPPVPGHRLSAGRVADEPQRACRPQRL